MARELLTTTKISRTTLRSLRIVAALADETQQQVLTRLIDAEAERLDLRRARPASKAKPKP
jgi:hypothetical protein